MKIMRRGVFLVFLACVGSPVSGWAMQGRLPKQSSPPRSVIVKFKPAFAPLLESNLSPNSLQMNAPAVNGARLQGFFAKHRVKSLKPLHEKLVAEKLRTGQLATSLAQAGRVRFARRAARFKGAFQPPDLTRTYVLSPNVASMQELHDIAGQLRADPNVEWAVEESTYTVQAQLNDPFLGTTGSWFQSYPDLWGINKIQAAGAWNTSVGTGVIVAVVDTGVDYNHPDLAANIWPTIGWDFVGPDVSFPAPGPNPMDHFGHGTHVAGTIGAVGNNGLGVAGVAWRAQIMAVKSLDDTGAGSDSTLAAGIQFAVDNGADVINMSWGTAAFIAQPLGSKPIEDALQYAQNFGVVLVAAAGNSNLDAIYSFPANNSAVITVAAFDSNDQKASFSNYGSRIDVAAPGVDILSARSAQCWICGASPDLVVGPYYLRLSGTSMATPHVSGLAALILSQHPQYSAEQVRQVLHHSADVVGVPGFDVFSGYGRINASKALQASAGGARAIITSPRATSGGQTLIPIIGTADGASFANYQLEYATISVPTPPTAPIYQLVTPVITVPVTNNLLANWDVSKLQSGLYILRLHVTDVQGQSFYYTVSPIPVLNQPINFSLEEPHLNTVAGLVFVQTAPVGQVSPALRFIRLDFAVDGITTLTFNDPNLLDEYQFFWDSTQVPPGQHTLKVTAYDSGGNIGTQQKTVTVVRDTQPPGLTVTSPTVGQISPFGFFQILGTVSDNVLTEKVDVYEGQLLRRSQLMHYGSTNVNMSISNLLGGPHTLTIVATDTSGNKNSKDIQVVSTANTDTVPPAVSFAAPTAGAVLSGTVLLKANASDPAADIVTFFLVQHGVGKVIPGLVGLGPPYQGPFDSTSLPDGTYGLMASAFDGASNEADQTIPITINNTTPGINRSQFLSNQNIPGTMMAGQSYTVSITMENTGTFSWLDAQGYQLGSQNPQDNVLWGFSRVRLNSGETIVPGQSKTFTFSVTAPSTPGPYNFQWRMVQGGAGWFGDLSPNVSVNVLSLAPSITSPSSATATVGSFFTYSITATNSPSSFNATGLPAGLSINTANGVISGAPATFGTYTVTLSATNASGIGNAILLLTVNPGLPPPVLTAIVLSPSNLSILVGQTQQFTALGKDQLGNNMSPQPSFIWTVTGGGPIAPSGLFTATTVGGPFTVTATASGVNGTAQFTVAAAFALPTPPLQLPPFIAVNSSITVGYPPGLGIISFHWTLTRTDKPGSPVPFSTPTGTLDLSTLSLVPGTYQISVTATDGSTTSAIAPATVQLMWPALALNLPTILPVNGTIDLSFPTASPFVSFTWDFEPAIGPPAGTSGFKSIARASAATIIATSPHLNLVSYNLQTGTYLVTVSATDGFGNQTIPAHASITLVSMDLSGVKVHPSPWRSDLHSGHDLTFDNLPLGSTIKIFTVSGRWVKTISNASGQTPWDLKNDSGDMVASGLYLYLVTDSQGGKTHGKFAVIR